MRTFDGVGELEEAVGSHLGYSEWHTISQDQVNAFADATGDHQWIHVDPDRAAAGPFRSTIAHGFLTVSLVPMLAWQVYAIEGLKAIVNYGADRLRFPSPVPVGSRVRAGVELTGLTPTGLGHHVTTRVTVEIENGAKPACVVEMIALVVP